MGIKQNNPGCNCCEADCANCSNGKLPTGIEGTFSGFPNEIYAHRAGYNAGSEPACTIPVAFSPGAVCIGERYKITGLSSIVNTTHTATGLTVGVKPFNPSVLCWLGATSSYTASGHIQQGEADAFTGCVSTWQDCESVSYDVDVSYSSDSFQITLKYSGSAIVTYSSTWTNDYCNVNSGSVSRSNAAPAFTGFCSNPSFSGCGNFNSFTLNYTITPTFP